MPTGPPAPTSGGSGGGSGILLSVSAPALQVPATAGGFVSDFSLAVGQAFMFNGSTNVNAQTTFSIVTQNNCAAAITTGGAYSFSALSQNVGSIVIQGVYLSVMYVITVTISKQIPGTAGPVGATGPTGSTGPTGPGGVSGLTLVLSNPSASVLAYASGNVPSFAGISGKATVLSGGTDVTASSVLSAVPSNLTGTVNSAINTPVNGQPMGYYQVTAMSSTIGTLTITAQYLGTNVTQVFNVTQVPTGYQIVSSLPSSGPALFEGNIVFLTTDGKLYRYHNGAWTSLVAATDVTGQLTAAQIASIAAAQITGFLTASQIASIASSQITGQLTNVQIASLDASQLTGFIQAPQIASVASTQITGQLTAAQIASLATSQLTGSIQTTQIASGAITTPLLAAGAVNTAALAANAVTAGTIAAGAVTAAAISAGSITSAQIAAGTILAGNIAAGTISSTQIATGAITATQLAAGSVSTAALAANAITAGTIAAGAVTAAAIAAGSITSAQIAAGTIVAGNIAASTITGTQIAANTITSAQIVAGSILAGDIAANSLTAAQIQAGTITANEIAANTIIGNNIQAGTITAAKMGVTSLSSMTANLGAISAGTISALSGQAFIDMNNGFIELNNGVNMLVRGVGFGAASNYLDWFGPTQSSASNFAACTDALAIYFLKTDGTYKFGTSTQASATTAYTGPSTTTVTIPAGKQQMILELFPDSGLGGHGDGSLKGGGGGTGGYSKSVYSVSGNAGQTVVVTLQQGNSTPTASTIASGTFSMTTMSGVGGNPGSVGAGASPGSGGPVTSGGNQINQPGNDGGSAVGNSRAGQPLIGIYGNGFPGGAGAISATTNNPGLPALAYVTFL